VPFCDTGGGVVRRARDVPVRWRGVLAIEECRGSMRARRGARHYQRVRRANTTCVPRRPAFPGTRLWAKSSSREQSPKHRDLYRARHCHSRQGAWL